MLNMTVIWALVPSWTTFYDCLKSKLAFHHFFRRYAKIGHADTKVTLNA